VTRDYTLELSGESDGAPLLSVFGGKLTTYRKLAQAACNKLKPWFSQMGEDWTASCRLPGGEFDCSVRELARAFALEFDWLDDRSALRIAEAYGAHARLWLKEERGQHFGAGLYESEVRYLIAREWAHSWKTFCGAAASWGCACRNPNSSSSVPGCLNTTTPCPKPADDPRRAAFTVRRQTAINPCYNNCLHPTHHNNEIS
jgi:hypothetical protein